MGRQILSEGSRYDGITRKLVRDIIRVFKENKTGEFSLPEYFDKEEMVYHFDSYLGDFSVTLYLEQDSNEEDYSVNGNYLRDDDTIEVKIISNPDIGVSSLYNLIGELNEVIRHELEHMKQKYSGFNFPRYTPKTPYGYYKRPHEIEAQLSGFKRLAKIQKKQIEDVITKWFEKNQEKHELKQKDVDRLIKKILDKNSN